MCAGTTAWSALRGAGGKAGDGVVTQGTGCVSLYALQLAKSMGATVIIILVLLFRPAGLFARAERIG